MAKNLGRMKRNKGAAGERELAKVLSEMLGVECIRGRQYHGLEGRDVVGIEGVHWESKRCEKLSVYAAMDQARADAKDGDVPVVCHRRNNREWLAIVPLSELVRLAKVVMDVRNEDVRPVSGVEAD